MQNGGKEYRVAYVDAGALTTEQPWAFVDYDGMLLLVVREEHTADDLTRAWAAFRAMDLPS